MALDKTDAAALNGSVSQFGKIGLADVLSEVVCPTLLVFGARDDIVRQPETLPGKDGSNRHCVSLDGCSHYPMLDQPAVFNRLLGEFMNHSGEEDLMPKNYWQCGTIRQRSVIK